MRRLGLSVRPDAPLQESEHLGVNPEPEIGELPGASEGVLILPVSLPGLSLRDLSQRCPFGHALTRTPEGSGLRGLVPDGAECRLTQLIPVRVEL
jgi:hypothetical protein